MADLNKIFAQFSEPTPPDFNPTLQAPNPTLQAPKQIAQPQGNSYLNAIGSTLGSGLNVLLNPLKQGELLFGVGKQMYNHIKDVAGGAISDRFTGREFKMYQDAFTNIKYTALNVSAYLNKQATDWATKQYGQNNPITKQFQNEYNANINSINKVRSDAQKNNQVLIENPHDLPKFFSQTAQFNALNLPSLSDSTVNFQQNPNLDTGKKFIGDLVKTGTTLADTIMVPAAAIKGIQIAGRLPSVIGDLGAEYSAAGGGLSGARKLGFATTTELGAPTLSDIGQQYSQGGLRGILAGTGQIGKKALMQGFGQPITEAPVAAALRQNFLLPISRAGIASGVYGLAQQGIGNLTDNQQLKDQAQSIFNVNLHKGPVMGFVNDWVAPMFTPEGIFKGAGALLTSEKTLGQAAMPSLKYFGKDLSTAEHATVGNWIANKAVADKLMMDSELAAKYTNKAGQIDLTRAVPEILPTLTKAEKQTAFNDILMNSGAKDIAKKGEQAQAAKNYIQAQNNVIRPLEQKYNLQPGTLSPLRQDTLTNTALNQMANDLEKWHGGTAPESVQRFLLPKYQQGTYDIKSLKEALMKSNMVNAFVDKNGVPIFAKLNTMGKQSIVDNLRYYSEQANRMIPLSAAEKAAVEQLGYQGVGFTPFVTKAQPKALKTTGTLAEQIKQIGGAPATQFGTLMGAREKIAPAIIENKILQLPANEIRGNRNLLGQAYDLLDRTLGLQSISNKQLATQYRTRLEQKLNEVFPAGVIESKTGDIYTVEKTVGDTIYTALNDIAKQGGSPYIFGRTPTSIQGLSKGALKEVFSPQDAKKIYKSILSALPKDYKTVGLDFVQNWARRYLPGYNQFTNAVLTLKYTQNPLFMKVMLPEKVNLIMAANSFNPFYIASSETLRNIEPLLKDYRSIEQTTEVLGKLGWENAKAASMAEQMMKGGEVYGLSKKYTSIGELMTNTSDVNKIKDVIQRTLHYADRTPLERSLNTILFPFSFEKKVYTQIFGGLGEQSGLLPILAFRGLNQLNNFMNSPEYIKWRSENPGEAYFLERLNPFHAIVKTNFPGQQEGLLKTVTGGLELGGQFGGGIGQLVAAGQKAAFGTTKGGKFTPPEESLGGKVRVFVGESAGTLGLVGQLTHAVNADLREAKFKKGQEEMQAAQAFGAVTGNKLLAYQIMRATNTEAGGTQLDKFFTNNPELDPNSSQFKGYGVIANKNLYNKQILDGAAKAKTAGEKLAYMQNIKLSGSNFYDKFFSKNPNLDPTSNQFQGFKKSKGGRSSASKAALRRNRQKLNQIRKAAVKKGRTSKAGKSSLTAMLAKAPIKTTNSSLSSLL